MKVAGVVLIVGLLVFVLSPKIPGLNGANLGDLFGGGAGQVFTFAGHFITTMFGGLAKAGG